MQNVHCNIFPVVPGWLKSLAIHTSRASSVALTVVILSPTVALRVPTDVLTVRILSSTVALRVLTVVSTFIFILSSTMSLRSPIIVELIVAVILSSSVAVTSGTMAATAALTVSLMNFFRTSILLNEHLQGEILQVLSPWTLAMKTAKKVIVTGVMVAMINDNIMQVN